MSSPFQAGFSFSSASSPLSYLIPPPPPPTHRTVQGGFSCDVLAQGCRGVEAAAVGAATTARQLPRPPPRQCPRCRSGNTKFCYYNNYSRKQPRYLCRACRRHWTEGGALRDVPVGGGRKNRAKGGAKASTTAAAQSSSSAHTDAFPDILRQMLLQRTDGGGYSIDLSAWMAAGDAGGAVGRSTAADANCSGAGQYWTGWQLQDDMAGFDGHF